MLPTCNLISASEYNRLLKPLLPERAFATSPRKLAFLALHLLVIFAGYVGIRFSGHWLLWLGCSVVIGHSLACIAFLAHELSHNAILPNHRLRYILELLFWGLNFIPPTVWRRVHNHTHHLHANTTNDPDRQFLTSEASTTTRWYSRLFYPNHQSPRWNLVVGFHFVPYIVRNILAAFYPNDAKPPLVPSKPRYTPSQRLAVAFELVAIALLQAAAFYLVGGTSVRYVFASPFAVLVTSTVVMAYVFTNHFLNPLCETNDPVASSTSVVVPPFFDRIHSHFSYHTEHHLFPGMNSDFYPAVSELLRTRYGDRYCRIRFREAWKRLWSNGLYVADTNQDQPHKD